MWVLFASPPRAIHSKERSTRVKVDPHGFFPRFLGCPKKTVDGSEILHHPLLGGGFQKNWGSFTFYLGKIPIFDSYFSKGLKYCWWKKSHSQPPGLVLFHPVSFNGRNILPYQLVQNFWTINSITSWWLNQRHRKICAFVKMGSNFPQVSVWKEKHILKKSCHHL